MRSAQFKGTMRSLGLPKTIVIVIFSLYILSNSAFNHYSTSVLAQPFVQAVKDRDW
jgi:hypothetical protein